MEGRETEMSDRTDYKGPAYPTEAHGSIPAFHSYEEEAEFWDTHDFTEFKQETTPVAARPTRGLSANVQVRFDPETDHELEETIPKQGLTAGLLDG
jgi:hypothetical protein